MLLCSVKNELPTTRAIHDDAGKAGRTRSVVIECVAQFGIGFELADIFSLRCAGCAVVKQMKLNKSGSEDFHDEY